MKKLIENKFIWRIKMRKAISELPTSYLEILHEEVLKKLNKLVVKNGK